MEEKFWDLWSHTEQLQIIYKKEVLEDKNFVEYQLYEENIITALQNIFMMTLEKEIYIDQEDERVKSNIFSIIGARGSGKTTALSEFCKVLKNISRNENSKKWWINHSVGDEMDREILLKKDINFHVLRMIDASLMDESEDLLEVILYELYEEYKEIAGEKIYRGSNAGLTREISSMFESLFQAYAFICGKGLEGASMYDFDYSMKNSFQIAKRINNLLDELLSLYGERQENTYFVIAIDDLDLNLRYGYQMLEQIQKFFSGQKIIIFITMDYEQMQRVCIEHFIREMPYSNMTVNEFNKDYPGNHLSNDYMMKIFPIQKRLFMPDIRREMKNIGVILGDNQMVSVKEFIMNKIADKMGIYYDIKGEKKHFCVPNSVRELVTYNDFINSLKYIPFNEYQYGIEIEEMAYENQKEEIMKNERMMHIYDQNHHQFNWDITMRLAQVTLNRSQKQIFTQLMDIELERRAAYFNKIIVADNGYLWLMEPNEDEKRKYCYGDLLEKIYKWGRQSYENKSLISCMIASFTSEMVREYMGYCYFAKGSKREKCGNRLKRFIGRGFSNKWIGEMVLYGFSEEVEYGKFILRFDFEDMENEIENLYFEERNRKQDKRRKIEETLRKCFRKEKFVKILECIDMFCVSKEGNNKFVGMNISINMESAKKSTEHGHLVVRLKKEREIYFDVLGMVIKSLDYKNTISCLHENIAEELEKYLRSVNKEFEKTRMDLRNLILNLLRENSILSNQDANIKDVAFPFYNLDMAYNVFKRIKINGPYTEKDDLISNIVFLYDKIAEELKKEMENYKFKEKIKYEEIWKNNPYYLELKHAVDQRDMTVCCKINQAINAMCTKMPEPDLAN